MGRVKRLGEVEEEVVLESLGIVIERIEMRGFLRDYTAGVVDQNIQPAEFARRFIDACLLSPCGS